MLGEMGHGHGADLFEHPAPVLVKQLVGAEGVHVAGPADVAEIGSDVAGKNSPGHDSQNVERMGCGAGVGALDDDSRGHIAEDEMAVPVAVVHLGRSQLRIDGQNAAGRSGSYHFVGPMQGEGRRAAGHQHIETETLDEALSLVSRAHLVLDENGCNRIYSSLKLDIRKGKSQRLKGKIASVETQIGEVSR